MIRLEIGSGIKPHPGYTTIDIEPSKHPMVVGDFRTMTFSDVEEIRSHHLLEHFSREEAVQVLKLWYAWLKPGGVLIVETPDFEGICHMFHVEQEWMNIHAYGSQEAEWAFHRDGWWEAKFREILPQVGFTIIELKKTFSRVVRKVPHKVVHKMPNIYVVAKKA